MTLTPDEEQRLRLDLENFKGTALHALDCVDRVFQDGKDPILPDFCGLGQDKFEAVVRLAREYKELKEEEARHPIPAESRAFVIEVIERDLKDKGFPSDAIAQMRDQVTRNGRWGTCAECPDATGAIYPARHRTEVFPERCPHTDRHDHWLGTDILAVYAYAKNLYESAEHLKAHRDLVSSRLEEALAVATARQAAVLAFEKVLKDERTRADKAEAELVKVEVELAFERATVAGQRLQLHELRVRALDAEASRV